MTQPAAYDVTTSFDPFNPSSFPNFGRKLDVELGNIVTTTDEIRTNLALIQRDDGELANDSVGRDQLAGDVAMGVNTPALWVTATSYSVRDSVIEAGIWYWAVTGHTSGAFATDLAAGLWEEIFDFTDFISDLALSDATPEAVVASVGSAGTSDFASRADHVHPYTAPDASTDAAVLALGGTVTSTFTSGTNAMTAKRRHRITGGTATIPALTATDNFAILEMAPAAGTTVTAARNSQTINGTAADRTWTGRGLTGPIMLFSFISAGAIRAQIIGSTAV